MKSPILYGKISFAWLILLTIIISLSCKKDEIEQKISMLQGIDAKKAMEIANTWHYQGFKDVTSYVNSKSVIFEFKNKEKVSIPLPSDLMVVAIAPYIRKTHR